MNENRGCHLESIITVSRKTSWSYLCSLHLRGLNDWRLCRLDHSLNLKLTPWQLYNSHRRTTQWHLQKSKHKHNFKSRKHSIFVMVTAFNLCVQKNDFRSTLKLHFDLRTMLKMDISPILHKNIFWLFWIIYRPQFPMDLRFTADKLLLNFSNIFIFF